MYFPTIIVTTALFGTFTTIAVPGSKRESKRATPCSGLESQPQCCAVGVLGIADLQCDAPPTDVSGVDDFVSLCASIRLEAQCCVIGALGEALLCASP